MFTYFKNEPNKTRQYMITNKHQKHTFNLCKNKTNQTKPNQHTPTQTDKTTANRQTTKQTNNKTTPNKPHLENTQNNNHI